MLHTFQLQNTPDGYALDGKLTLCHEEVWRIFGVKPSVSGIEVKITSSEAESAGFVNLSLQKGYQNFWTYCLPNKGGDYLLDGADYVLNKIFPDATRFRDIDCWIRITPIETYKAPPHDGIMDCPYCGNKIASSSTGRIWCPRCRNGTVAP